MQEVYLKFNLSLYSSSGLITQRLMNAFNFDVKEYSLRNISAKAEKNDRIIKDCIESDFGIAEIFDRKYKVTFVSLQKCRYENNILLEFYVIE
jgi:asparagine N-glycosylation enzyme membrane subunit Stt3